MLGFKVTDTPVTLDTYSGNVEEITATWEDGAMVLTALTESPEGFSVPVRLRIGATLVNRLQREYLAARAITAPAMGVPVTKWDLVDKVERVLLDATPTRGHDGGHIRCGGCGVEHKTEGDFARHYIVPDRRYANLGHCPNRDV